VNITDKLQQVGVFLAQDGFVTILKEMPIPVMPPVKIDGITGKQSFHQNRDGYLSCPQQKVKVIGNQGPCITRRPGFGQQIAKPIHESCIILLIAKYILAINASHHNMVQSSRSVYA
jgi:hypothetical protein